MMKVVLKDIIDNMEFQIEDYYGYVCRRTGEVVFVSKTEMRNAEEMDDDEISQLHEADDREMLLAIDVLDHDEDYVMLPTVFEINEYEMLERFVLSLQAGRAKDKLLNAIRGKGAFRRGKDLMIELGFIEKWYQFRDRSYEEKAIEWCKEHELEYE